MTPQSIYHLEPFPQFLRRIVDLNRLYCPDDPLHDAILHHPAPPADAVGATPGARAAGGAGGAGVSGAAAADASGADDNDVGGAAGSIQEEGAVARRKLATLHRDFPFGAPVHEQAAFLLRGFSGFAPFMEANERTGWDFVADLLAHREHTLLASQAEGRALATQLWQRMQAAYPQGLQRTQVLDRDEVFESLADWFRTRVA